jgi:hypothetical protein
MLTGRGEALSAARKMLRGFAGAPDARRHAQTLYSEVARADGWSKTEQDQIIAMGIWLQSRPGLGELKVRCEQLITHLSQ